MNWLIRSRLKILYCLIRLRSQNQNYLELELSITREQINRFASSKLDHMLSIQKSYLDKSGLGFVDSIFVSETHSTNFVSSSKPSKIEVVNQKKMFQLLGRLGLILQNLSLRVLNSLRTRSMIYLYGFIIFVEKLGVRTYVVHMLRTYVILYCNWLIL